MALQGATITLSSGTAVALAGETSGATVLHGNLRVYIRNQGTGTAYLGGSAVTTAGYPLTTADSPLLVHLFVGETIYGCCTGAAVLNVLRFNETTS